jgi:PAS domain S-box-containing protein
MQEDGLRENYHELEQRYALMRQMLDSSVAAIGMMEALRDANGQIIDFIYRECNKAAETFNRLSSEEIRGKHFLDFFPPAAQQLFHAYVAVVESGEPVHIEYKFPYEYFPEDTWVDIHAVKNGDGVILTYLDITNQKKAEAAITEQSHFLNSIVNTIPDMISVMDLHTLKLEFINPAVFPLNGFDPNGIISRNLDGPHKVTHQDDRPELNQYFANLRAANDEEIFTAEYRARTDNGMWQCFKVRGKVFRRNAAGAPTHCINIIQNITPQKQAEIEKSKAMESKMEADRLATIGKMNRAIAHEIRNPLSAITMVLAMMEDEGEKLQNDALKRYAAIAGRNAARIDKLITDMLYIYKEQGRQGYFAVTDLLDEAIYLAADRLDLTSITIEKSYKYSCDLFLDKESVIIALLSIISNAIEAMAAGKGLLQIHTEEQDGHCHIMIKDNGHGIPAAELDKIFEPFFSRKTYGLGLGLSNALDIIERNNGTIEVNSGEGEGTVFIIRFPARQPVSHV